MPCSGSYLMPKNPLNVPSPPAVKGSPKNVGFGILEMPFGPFVTSVQLSSTMRMISPKASVTMAR